MGSAFKLDRKLFSESVEDYVKTHDVGYIEAILALCEQHNIEPESASKILTKPIKEKLQIEGQELKLLPKPNQLPL